MGKKEETGGFSLPNETVKVKFIRRRRGMAAHVDDNHVISGGMLTNSKRSYSAPLRRKGGIANVLSNEEKEYLENKTGLDLSVYGDFWKTFSVNLFKEDANNVFDLSIPMDYISVKLLKTLKNKIAPAWKLRNQKQTYEFVITGENEEFNENKVKLDTKKLAFKLYGKLEDDREKLLGILKLLTNQPISKDSKLNWLQGKVEEFVDTTPSNFLRVVQDEDFDTKVLIGKGVETGIIIRNGNKYSTIDGLELCENGQVPSFNNVVDYLNNPKNQDVRSLIEAKVDKK